jgi:hypothetical protein
MKTLLFKISFFIILVILSVACVYQGKVIHAVINEKIIWFLFFSGVLLFVYSYLFTTEYVFRLNAVDFSVLLLLTYIIIHTLANNGWVTSKHATEILALLAFYIVAKSVFQRFGYHYKYYSIFFLFITVTQIAIAVLQWFEIIGTFNNGFKFSGFFFNPSPFAIHLGAGLCYVFTIIIFTKQRSIKVLSILIFAAGLLVVLISQSRSAWLGLLVALVVVTEIRFGLFKNFIGRQNSKVRIISIILLVLTLVIVAAYVYNFKRDSADGRLLTWKLAGGVFKENFFTGVGKDNLPAALFNYQSEYFEHHDELKITEGQYVGETWFAFNDILQVATEFGVAGIALLMLVLLIVFSVSIHLIRIVRFSIRTNHGEPDFSSPIAVIGSVAIIIVISVSGLTSYPLTLLPIQILFFASIAIISSRYPDVYIINMEVTPSRFFQYVFSLVSIGLGIFFIYYSTYLYIGYQKWFEADLRGYQLTEIQRLKEQYSFLKQDQFFLLTEGYTLLENGSYGRAIKQFQDINRTCQFGKKLHYGLASAYLASGRVNDAEREYIFLSNAIPHLIKPRYELAKIYYEYGPVEKWDALSKEIICAKPKIESTETDSMIEAIKEMEKKRNKL